ncbi:MAG TPA: RNA polymerase sigma factor [Dongiaceae bacterium]|nr:RNA polymerase sigma factor [Dongiaceae bacterium]
MNPTRSGGVFRLYQESGAIAGHDDTVREWTLNHPEGESAAPAARRDDSRAAMAAEREREWEALLGENAPLAFRVARGVLRNDADAQDVAQEALLRAYRRFDRLRERERFRAWLVRISFRLALDRRRAIRRREVREAEWERERTRTSARPGGQDAGEPFSDALQMALEELPPKQRLVLLLTAMEGHSLEEVAALAGVPLGTVKSRLFTAKRTLAEKLRCFVKPTSGN